MKIIYLAINILISLNINVSQAQIGMSAEFGISINSYRIVNKDNNLQQLCIDPALAWIIQGESNEHCSIEFNSKDESTKEMLRIIDEADITNQIDEPNAKLFFLKDNFFKNKNEQFTVKELFEAVIEHKPTLATENTITSLESKVIIKGVDFQNTAVIIVELFDRETNEKCKDTQWINNSNDGWLLDLSNTNCEETDDSIISADKDRQNISSNPKTINKGRIKFPLNSNVKVILTVDLSDYDTPSSNTVISDSCKLKELNKNALNQNSLDLTGIECLDNSSDTLEQQITFDSEFNLVHTFKMDINKILGSSNDILKMSKLSILVNIKNNITNHSKSSISYTLNTLPIMSPFYEQVFYKK